MGKQWQILHITVLNLPSMQTITCIYQDNGVDETQHWNPHISPAVCSRTSNVTSLHEKWPVKVKVKVRAFIWRLTPAICAQGRARAYSREPACGSLRQPASWSAHQPSSGCTLLISAVSTAVLRWQAANSSITFRIIRNMFCLHSPPHLPHRATALGRESISANCLSSWHCLLTVFFFTYSTCFLSS